MFVTVFGISSLTKSPCRYISSDKVEQGLQNGTLHVGKFRINKTNRNEAYVTAQSPTSLADDVFIPKSRLQNRAFDGDVVVVKLLDGEELEKEMKDEKDRKEKKMAESHTRQKICEVEEIEAVDVFGKILFFCSCSPQRKNESRVLLEHQETRIFGKVVYIQETNSDSRVFVGTLSLERHSASSDQKTKADTETKVVNRYVWFKPVRHGSSDTNNVCISVSISLCMVERQKSSILGYSAGNSTERVHRKSRPVYEYPRYIIR